MENLKDKVIVITGGATGIGFALAKAFGADGAKIVIGEQRQEQLKIATDALADLDVEAVSMVMDVSDLDSVNAFADFSWKTFGRVDMLINNAGISGARGAIHKINVDEARHIFNVNFFGVWHGCAVFSGRMIEQGTPAAIFNLGSENSLFPAVPKSPAYIASKHAVLGLSESLRQDLPDFIHVGTIFPGYVSTPLTGNGDAGMPADEFAEIVKKQIVAGEHFIVSHSYNMVHVDARQNDLESAYERYAPRHDGDDKYDVGKIIEHMVAARKPRD